MKLGSLFDGSGTAPLAATMCGIEPVWASEIEPYPIKVTKARFPGMAHLGDITKINGAEVEPVDIICGGSPCQDLSVAGKQKGLKDGDRSHLFYEMTRIIKEMREATNGKYPRYIIWENVPGAFSSNNGRDFLAVLQAFAEIADSDVYVPEPPHKGKTDRLAWRYAGSIVGDGWSITWRTVDAQYWGVPQRRRRIYLIADFASERAGEILFERKGVPGNTEPSRTQGQETASDAGRSADGSGVSVSCNRKQLGLDIGYEVASTILANDFKEPQCVVFEPKSMLSENWAAHDVKNAIRSGESKSAHAIVCLNDQGGSIMSVAVCFTADCRNGVLNEELSGTIQAKPNGGYSLNYQNPVVYPGVGITSKDNYSNPKPGDAAPTLDTDSRKYLVSECYPNITGPLMANSHPGSYTGQDAFSDMLPVVPSDKPHRKYIVRRLTPLECCRLQGFPDWWEDGVEGSDSARYKMWGNGMALPNMLHVMKGIAETEDKQCRTMS